MASQILREKDIPWTKLQSGAVTNIDMDLTGEGNNVLSTGLIVVVIEAELLLITKSNRPVVLSDCPISLAGFRVHMLKTRLPIGIRVNLDEHLCPPTPSLLAQ